MAVKLLRPELADDPEFRTRFTREVSALTRVMGVCTVRVDRGGHRVQAAVPRHRVRRRAHAVRVRRHLRPDDPEMLFGLATGLAEALTAIHGVGIVHRDLKPSNVLLTRSGPKVIDFGIAHTFEATSLTAAGMTVGSAGFMAPEQVMGRAGTAADIFCWALTIAYAASGRSPFGAGAPDAIMFRILHETPDIAAVPAAVPPAGGRGPGQGPAQPALRARPAGQADRHRLAALGRARQPHPDDARRDLAPRGTPALHPVAGGLVVEYPVTGCPTTGYAATGSRPRIRRPMRHGGRACAARSCSPWSWRSPSCSAPAARPSPSPCPGTPRPAATPHQAVRATARPRPPPRPSRTARPVRPRRQAPQALQAPQAPQAAQAAQAAQAPRRGRPARASPPRPPPRRADRPPCPSAATPACGRPRSPTAATGRTW